MTNMSCKSWTYPETQALLDIWQQEHIQTQLTLMARNRPVWEQVAEIMKYRKGFNRTGEQCKTRIHTLKIRYNRAKKFGLSGPEAEKECPFYRQLDAVLGKNWIKKQELETTSPPITTSSSIASLYPLTFANDIDRISMGHNGMIQILPKPIPKYVDTTAFSKVAGPGLKVSNDKLEDMMGEHSKLIKKMLSTLTGTKDPSQPVLKDTDGLDELLKSLVNSPVNTETPEIATPRVSSFSSPTSPPANIAPEENDNQQGDSQHASKRRKVAETDPDKVILMGSMAQVINNITELNKNIKQTQEQEDRKLKWWMDKEDKRFALEREHFKKMESLFSTLVTYFANGEVKQHDENLCSDPNLIAVKQE